MFTSALACLALTIYHEARNQDLQRADRRRTGRPRESLRLTLP
jgi:hypothetical protein